MKGRTKKSECKREINTDKERQKELIKRRTGKWGEKLKTIKINKKENEGTEAEPVKLSELKAFEFSSRR
jgi:hypothetical protein